MFLVCLLRDWTIGDALVPAGDDALVDARELNHLLKLRVAFVVNNPDRLRLENARQLTRARSTKPCCNR